MSYIIKRAGVNYTPTMGNVSDTIYISHEGVELQEKTFFIYPTLNWEWTTPATFYRGLTYSCSVTPHIKGCESMHTSITIKDNMGTVLLDKPKSKIETDEPISFDFDVTDDKDSKAQFTVIYKVNSMEETSNSDWIPVEEQETNYIISITNPPLRYHVEDLVELTAINSEIPTGETINFKSTYGLDSDGTLKEE